MVKKYNYPLEAFALALVLFSSGMKEAMLTGIALIFGDVLISVLQEKSEKSTKVIAGIGALIMVIVLAGIFSFTGVKTTAGMIFRFVILGVLLVKHAMDHEKEEKDYDGILFADSMAYGMFVLVSILREYLSTKAIFGISLPKIAFCNSALGQTMYVLILGGLAIAILNQYLGSESNKDAGLWVCVPTFILETGLIFQNVLEADGKILGVVVVGILYFTYRYLLKKANLPKILEGVSIEMILLGVIYLVFSII